MRNTVLFICIALFQCLALAASPEDSSAARTKYLHISTNPSHADVYVNNVKPNHSKTPDYKLPGFIPVPAGEPNIIVSLFRPEYADTTINVTLSQKDTSFLIVALRPTYDAEKTEKQYSEVAHRSRRKIGHKLLFTSIVPFVVSGIAASVAYYNIDRANSKKDDIEKAIFSDSEQYRDANDKFKDYRDNARNAKNVMNFGLILGGVIFTTGVVLSF